MKVAAHQPNYLPYLGYFDKMIRSDEFFILDNAQFSKGDFHNRNRIKVKDGKPWITIPVEKELIPVKDIKIKWDQKIGNLFWYDYHTLRIRDNYQHAPFYQVYFPQLKDLYNFIVKNSDKLKLAENNMLFIKFIMDAFGIRKDLVMSSSLDISTKGSQRLVDICKTLGADIYLSGDGAREYLDEILFQEAGITVEYQNYVHPIYPQQHGEFQPYMSAIDYLFNCGGNLPTSNKDGLK